MSDVICGRERKPAVVGRTLFDYADELSVVVPSTCRRTGRCHECVVEVLVGTEVLSPRSEAEGFLKNGFRLACQAAVERTDTEIAFVPLRHKPQILTSYDGAEEGGAHDPAVTRQGDKVCIDGIAVDDHHGHVLGMAIDLGTTTIVIDLVDIENGETLARSAFENPQRFGGSDVMSRISYDAGQARGELQNAVVKAINSEIKSLSETLGFRRREIYEVVIAGNSTMRDLLFGFDVQGIGQKPYKSLVEHDARSGKRSHTALDVPAASLGILANKSTRAYGLPLLASHVGGDVAAGILALGMLDPAPEPRMLVDIGTNTEVVVSIGSRLICASCPAGPAFEGGGVEFGMPGYEGAIERISVDREGRARSYDTIGGVEPRGICGSGLVDLLAELRRVGVMGLKGTLDHIPRRQKLSVVPEHGITLSRQDVSHLAQAKAANYCGQFIVLRACDLAPAEIGALYISGGFANYLDIENAIEIGFLAPVPRARIRKAGNASLRGAKQALLSVSARRRLEALMGRIEHVELETSPDFFEIFVEGCQFKPMPEDIGMTATAHRGQPSTRSMYAGSH
jgi:uncharacterized 2Fe-2S/4Fe-4S cluster protein (DUF4445 family)